MVQSGTGIEGFAGLSADVNKKKGETFPDKVEGVVSDKLEELTLDMPDEDIITLTKNWEKAWDDSPKKAEWIKQIEENEKYWLGKQFDLPKLGKNRPSVDNLIFESLETYLPQVTRRNPEPLVTLSVTEKPSDINSAYILKVKDKLGELADDGENAVRLKLKRTARHWAIFQLGIVKFGWDLDKDIPSARVIRAKKIILDPDAWHDEDGYSGGRIGEYRKMEAGKLLDIMGIQDETKDEEGKVMKQSNKDAIKAIKEKVTVEGKPQLGTDIQFIEWWTPKYFAWKLGDHVLLKKKNPNWNYRKMEPVTSVDDTGDETQEEEEVEGINHFNSPQMPFEFLTVFNLGDQPMDKTGLIHQNLANQDRINKRSAQIDKNASDMNGGMVVSLERSGLTAPQAKGVTEALRKGGTIVIPAGSPREAIDRFPPGGLPADVYNDLVDSRERLKGIFGVQGSSPSGAQKEKTVRGKIINRTLDSDRIGGGISEALELLAGKMYGHFVQMLYVYDTEFQFIDGGRPPKVKIGVKEGSLLPKDSLSIANQAIELAVGGKMALVDMYERLEYPNPEEMAANVWLEVNAPNILYRDNLDVQEALQMQQVAAQAQAQANAGAQGGRAGRPVAGQAQTTEQPIEEGTEGDQPSGSILSQVPQDVVAKT